jgi:hypothetical protein
LRGLSRLLGAVSRPAGTAVGDTGLGIGVLLLHLLPTRTRQSAFDAGLDGRNRQHFKAAGWWWGGGGVSPRAWACSMEKEEGYLRTWRRPSELRPLLISAILISGMSRPSKRAPRCSSCTRIAHQDQIMVREKQRSRAQWTLQIRKGLLDLSSPVTDQLDGLDVSVLGGPEDAGPPVVVVVVQICSWPQREFQDPVSWGGP